MVSERDQELVQRAVDGELTAEEQHRLKGLLDGDPDVRRLYEELRGTLSALSTLQAIDPPRTLRPAVMRAIATAPAPATPGERAKRSIQGAIEKIVRSITLSPTKEAAMSPAQNRTKYGWLIAGSVVAIVAVVYFSFYYPPAPAEDAQGTIGAAQKYRSEQITDKDVVTGTITDSPFAEQIMADAGAMDQLGRAVSMFQKTAASFEAKPALDRTIAADLSATAAALDRTISLGKSIGLQKTIAADLLDRTISLDKNAVAAMGAKGTLDKTIASELQRTSGALELEAKAVSLNATARALDQKAVMEKAPVADLQKTSALLERAAVLYRTGKLERTTVNDLLGAMATFDKSAAPALEQKTALEAKAVSELNAKAAELGRSASALQQKFSAEMRSTLEQRQSLDQKQSLEQKQSLDQKQSLEQKPALDRKAPAEH